MYNTTRLEHHSILVHKAAHSFLFINKHLHQISNKEEYLSRQPHSNSPYTQSGSEGVSRGSCDRLHAPCGARFFSVYDGAQLSNTLLQHACAILYHIIKFHSPLYFIASCFDPVCQAAEQRNASWLATFLMILQFNNASKAIP